MVLRRFREHAAKHNWFSVAIDLAIVVIGVFLGMQANNWNEARLDRNRGQQYRQRLIDDLVANDEDFRQRTVYYRQVHDAGYAALQDLRRSKSADPVAFLLKSFKAANILPRSTQRATYQEILSAGALGLVGDESIRRRIMTYYAGLDMTDRITATVPPYRDRVRSIMPYEIQQTLLVDCPEEDREDAQGRPDVFLNASCRPHLDPKEAWVAAAQVRSAPGIQLDLTRSIIDADQKILQFQSMQRSAVELRAILEPTVPTRRKS
ncbi:MAG TPA: hypothetical protein VFU91_03810 [Sphingomicrobium sp.]|nr:hypothetical protein [Sphingomicrobium sp.]